MTEFERLIAETHPEAARATGLEILQVNVGLRCNMACAHCHQSCSPDRTEIMDEETMAAVVSVADAARPSLVDITGGSPELHPRIREFITALRDRDLAVQVRTNLTVLAEPDVSGLDEFFAANQVRLLASFPGPNPRDAEGHRGSSAHDVSVDRLRRLGDLGYGTSPGLQLDIAYNPSGTTIPRCGDTTEQLLRAHLGGGHGITFGDLITITNMPIGRFREQLADSNQLGTYRQDLRDAFNHDTLLRLSCRTTLEVAWDGRLSDCDFNLAAGLTTSSDAPGHISEFDLQALSTRQIRFAEHCYACAAQAGSG